MFIVLSAVLLLVMIVRGSRWLAALVRDLVSGSSYQQELPADYGMNPQRPWERRPRRGVRPGRRPGPAVLELSPAPQYSYVAQSGAGASLVEWPQPAGTHLNR